MNISIFLSGKEYVSAARAAEVIGYSSDYIGQLCRTDRIPSKFIGRTWYVDLDALRNHRQERVLGKPKRFGVDLTDKPNNLAKGANVAAGGRTNFTYEEPSSLRFQYGSDPRELMPTLIKKAGATPFFVSNRKIRKSKFQTLQAIPVVLLVLFSVIFLGVGLFPNSSLVKEKAVAMYQEFFLTHYGSAQEAASILSKEISIIWGDLISNEEMSALKEDYKNTFELGSGLSNEQIRLILLGGNSYAEDEKAVNLIIEPLTVSTNEEIIRPVENPFGLPE